MKGKYIYFIERPNSGAKTKRWEILNTSLDIVLGEIRWFSSWRKYAFFPKPETVFEADCMNDIVRFLSFQMESRKKEKKRVKP